MTLKDELPRSVGAQYATGEEWRNSSRKKKEAEPKRKQHSVVDGSGSQIRIYLGLWQLRLRADLVSFAAKMPSCGR